MKKLKKLEISPEKIMKNEELINLQGGGGGDVCHCEQFDPELGEWIEWHFSGVCAEMNCVECGGALTMYYNMITNCYAQ